MVLIQTTTQMFSLGPSAHQFPGRLGSDGIIPAPSGLGALSALSASRSKDSFSHPPLNYQRIVSISHWIGQSVREGFILSFHQVLS